MTRNEVERWRIIGVWTVDGDAPQRVAPSPHVDLEEQLEDWIVADPTLLPGDLKIIGRQVTLDGGRLDLLAIDWQLRWVVIEIKRGQLQRETVAQALDYAWSIERLPAGELRANLFPPHPTLHNVEELSSVVQQQLQSEATSELRDVQVMVVGVGVNAGLDRISEYLGRFEVPITVVSFRVFERDRGPHLLIREIPEEQAGPQKPPSPHSLHAIQRNAEEAGVASQLDRFLTASKAAGLRVQPRKYAVRIAAPQDARHRLMYARPEKDGMAVGVSPDKFAEFFPPLTEDEVTRSVSMNNDGVVLYGAELDARLDQIETFLKENLPRPDPADAD